MCEIKLLIRAVHHLANIALAMEIFSVQSIYENEQRVCFVYSYEPELFPGLIYRMVKPRIVLLIFVSGKVVLTGECCSLLVKSSTEI